jgi:rhodanese-related sulfurtransferase
MDTIMSSITPSELLQRCGSARTPFLIDVRRLQAFEADGVMIAGATWRDPFFVSDWIKHLPRHREVAVYCAEGHEISQDACSALRDAGLNARFLEGGIVAWKAGGGPTIRKQSGLPIPSTTNSPSKWITRERPKIDRIACSWLIRRFVDPCAEFLYVPSSQVRKAAETNRAIPYDVPDVRFSHRGDRCSFDAFLADFELNDPALSDLAAIVRGADTGRSELTPQSPGLLAISLGLSALFEDDHVMLEHGMIVYDALYAWCRIARAETHNTDLFGKRP